MEFELLCQQVTEARKQRGDDPRATLPDYVYTEKAASNGTADHENDQDGSANEMEVAEKPALDSAEVQAESSCISTRNSAKRNRIQRSSSTRKQAKDKEGVNGHNEVRLRLLPRSSRDTMSVSVQETVLSADDTASNPATADLLHIGESTTSTTHPSPHSSPPSSETSNKKRTKRTVSTASLSPSKVTAANDSSTEAKAKRQRTEADVEVCTALCEPLADVYVLSRRWNPRRRERSMPTVWRPIWLVSSNRPMVSVWRS